MASQSGISVVAFDMYGTLVVNGVDLWLATFQQIVEAQRLPIPSEELYREWRSRDVLFRRDRVDMRDPEKGPPFRTYYEAWRDEFEATFQDLGLHGDPEKAARRCTEAQGLRTAFPDAMEVLPWLRERCRLAVLSNADHLYLMQVIERHNWEFEVVVSSESARTYKPAPSIFQTFCQAVAVKPEEVLYVGDSTYDDVHGARLSGLRAAWLRRGEESPGTTPPPDGEELLPPDFEIGSLLDLKRLFPLQAGPA